MSRHYRLDDGSFFNYKVCDYEKKNDKYVDWSFNVFIDDGYATHSIIIRRKKALPSLSG